MRKNRLVFIVEGDSELNFVHNKLMPYFYSQIIPAGTDWTLTAQKITTNRRLNAKGGVISFEYLKNEVKRVAEQSEPWITTFLDFFRLPTNFPCYSTDVTRIDEMESAIKKELGYAKIIPYIQKYEYETLLFADVGAFAKLPLTDRQLALVGNVVREYPQIEDINGGSETAPSKRLKNIFDYDKVTDSQIIMEQVPIETLMAKAPRFASWIRRLSQIFEE